MAFDFRKFGLDEAEVLRDTHAQTAMRVAAIVGDTLELAIKSKLLAEGRPVSENMFKKDGRYATLEQRIDGACELKLIDDVTQRCAFNAARAKQIRSSKR